jgi:hypothetical protein
MIHCRGRPDLCAMGATPLILLFTTMAIECCRISVQSSMILEEVSGLETFSVRILLYFMMFMYMGKSSSFVVARRFTDGRTAWRNGYLTYHLDHVELNPIK